MPCMATLREHYTITNISGQVLNTSGCDAVKKQILPSMQRALKVPWRTEEENMLFGNIVHTKLVFVFLAHDRRYRAGKRPISFILDKDADLFV